MKTPVLFALLATCCVAEPPVDTRYLPPQQGYSSGPPAQTYGAPTTPARQTDALFRNSPSSTYGAPSFSSSRQPSRRPSNQYGPPQPSNQYGPPQPSNQYGPPQLLSQYGAPSSNQGPSSQYGAPSFTPSQLSSQYGAPGLNQPSSQYRPPNGGSPSNQYLPPSRRSGRRNGFARRPSVEYGAPSPSQKYGAPSPSQQYGAPSPSQQYGAPSHSQHYDAPGAGGDHYSGSGNLGGAPSTTYGAPEQSRAYLPPGQGRGGYGGDDGNGEPANYSFEYMVKDELSGNDFGHRESRQGDRAEGLYYVLLPDGRKQTVEYEADQDGYRPKISYEDTGRGREDGRGAGGYDDNAQGYSGGGPY